MNRPLQQASPRTSAALCFLLLALAAGCRVTRSGAAPEPEPPGPAAGGETAGPQAEPLKPAEDPDRTALGSHGRYRLSYRPEPDPIPLNRSFELELTVRGAGGGGPPVDGLDLRVSGWMPDHGHGMNRRPRVTPQGGGRYLVRGMLLHMPGHWEIYVELVDDDQAERARFDVLLR